jgi:hypothetical protein
MIGPGGLLLVVPHVYAHAVPVLLVALPEKKKKKKAKLRHLILLSILTYWAPLEMLLLRCLNWHNKLCGKFLLSAKGGDQPFLLGAKFGTCWRVFGNASLQNQ